VHSLHRFFLTCVLALGSACAATPVKIGFPHQIALGVRDTIELEFQTEAEKIYQVEVSADLKTWAYDGYAIVGTGGLRTHITSTRGLPKLFFRVRNDGSPNRVLAGGGAPGPPGPAGPQGPQGPPGSSTIDPAAFATAAQGAKADTALQPGHTPSSNEAQAFWATLNHTSLRDRFDRPERYPEGAKISHLASLPELGPAWRVSGNPKDNIIYDPYIDKGAFRAAEATVSYLGNSISSPGGKFSLFFEFSVETMPVFDPGLRLGMNVSFDSNTMITDNGYVIPAGVVHINWDDYGITAINFFNHIDAYIANIQENKLRIVEHQLRTGDGFTMVSGVPPSPLQLNTNYYAHVLSATEIAVAATPEDAIAGNTIDLTAIGTGPHTLRYIHAPFTSINRSPIGGRYYWHPGLRPLIPNRRYVMFIKAEGEVVEVGIAGVGSILFENPQLPGHIGQQTTNFWWESGGATTVAGGGRFYAIGKLHSVWSLPDLNTSWLSSFGGEPLPSLGTAGPYNFRGPIRSLGADALQMAAALPPLDFRFIAGANGTLDRGAQKLAKGGHAFIEGGYLSNVGATGNGMELLGRAPMAIDNAVIDPIRSPASAANAVLKSVRLTPVLEPGDSEELEYFGVLNGTQAKRILLMSQTGNQVLFDSNLIGTSLTPIEGPFTISLLRHARAGGANTCFAKFQTPGINHLQRTTPTGMGDTPGSLNFTATAVPEGGVTLEAVKQVVHRVKNN
jgi:hypothetical protein